MCIDTYITFSIFSKFNVSKILPSGLSIKYVTI